MTDKQIIIDGCDVSGCDCYCDGKCLCEYNEINRKIIRYYSCNKFPNCNYKQLKAKEQECEELKEKLIKWLGKEGLRQSEKEFYEQQLDQLKAENEELKKKCNIYTCGICGNKEDCNKLYKTLAEIKEIAEKEVNNRMLFADKESFCDFNKILQIISECEVEDETN